MYRRVSSLPEKTRRDNQRILALFASHLGGEGEKITPEMMKEMESLGLSPEEGYARLLAALYGVEEEAFFQSHLLPSLRLLREEAFKGDAYFQKIPFAEAEVEGCALRMLTLPAYEGVVAGDLSVSEEGRLLPPIGFFRKDYRYPAILEGEREWMTLLPVECITMRRPVRDAFGRVLTYGLGLGYFAFHASEKEEVSSVTVVEKNPKIISLFQKYILPHFPHKEKIRIMEADAFRFAASVGAGEYDFVFADTWHDAADGLPHYLRFLPHQREGTTYAYWIEDTLLCYLDDNLFPERKED